MSLLASVMLLPLSGTFIPEFSQAMEQRQYAVAKSLMEQRLSSNAGDPKGLAMQTRLHFARAIEIDEDELTDALEDCIDENPDAFECHLALGEIYGRQASGGGMMKGMMLADDILERFQDAVRLKPDNVLARNYLQSFYLAAPGIAGGGRDKADANAADFAKHNATYAPLLSVSGLIRDKKAGEAEKVLLALPVPEDGGAREVHLGALVNLAFERINEKDFETAKRVSSAVVERYPNSASGHVALGRIELESGDVNLAVEKLEHALKMDPNCGANYRLGLAYEKLGRTEDARTQYQIFVSVDARKGQPTYKEAQARLKALKQS